MITYFDRKLKINNIKYTTQPIPHNLFIIVITFLLMAYVSDITNQFGVKETGSDQANQVPASKLDDQTQDDPIKTYEPEDTIRDDYGHIEKDSSKLPRHLFDDAQSSYEIEKYLLKLREKEPRYYPTAGVTNSTYYAPYKYQPIYPEGFSRTTLDIGSIVKMPVAYTVEKPDEHGWDCGCMPDL